ncbi:T9SS type A sorting domain-containing protein [bacterium SCSIO 12643]|nr:T9SS type A sorting domain-containing protein [bacterium SCSIO 12643]
MCTHLLNNKLFKLISLCGISFLLFVPNAWAQKWEGLGIGNIGLAYFNHLSVDSVQDKLVLGGTDYLTQVNGVSSSSILKWTPENGVEILAPHDLNLMGVTTINDVLFSHDSMIVVGDFGIAIYKNNQWIYNYTNTNHAVYKILPYKNHYLLALGYSYFHPLKKNAQLVEWDGDTTFTEFQNITDVTYTGDGIFAMTSYQGNLYVGGTGSYVSGSLMNGMMMWNGQNWSDCDSGITDVSNLGGINDMIEYKGDLYIGGMFYQTNHSKENMIARWDGQNWKTVGGGFGWGLAPGSETIRVMEVHNGYLYVAGRFETPGGIPASSVARWDGHEWCGCGSSFNGVISGMTHYRDTLYVSGNFNVIDGDSIVKIARFIGDDFADTCGSISVGIKTLEAEKKQLVGYPNPVRESIYLMLPELQNQEVEIQVYNQVGQLMFQRSQYVANQKLQLDLSQLSQGMYFGELITKNKNYVFSFVKE